MSEGVTVATGIVTLAFILLCMIWDIRSRRIPNWLSGGMMLGGVAINFVSFGPAGVYASLTGLLVLLAVLLPPFALGGIGGGDVKMMAALGALLGPLRALTALIIGSILGGVVMVAHLARRGRLREKLAATRHLCSAAVSARSIAPLKLSSDGPDVVLLPYSVPLGVGAIAVMLLSGVIGGA
jgi:prepilin peptidase CpaA